MNSQDIQQHIADWAGAQNFSAPYGILTGQHVNRKGTKFLTVTFGRARTLDLTVEIYNSKFIILRSSRNQSQAFNDLPSLMQALAEY